MKGINALYMGGRDSSVGIATRYGLDGSGIESRCDARFSATVQIGPGAHPASCAVGTGSLQGVKRPGRGADPQPHFQCRGLQYGRAIPLPTLRVLEDCKGDTFTLYVDTYFVGLLTPLFRVWVL